MCIRDSKDKAFLLGLVERNGAVLGQLQVDRDFALAAVRRNAEALEHAPAKLREDPHLSLIHI
eukprot:11788507-Alexandrium_andersonii.AAC.1